MANHLEQCPKFRSWDPMNMAKISSEKKYFQKLIWNWSLEETNWSKFPPGFPSQNSTAPVGVARPQMNRNKCWQYLEQEKDDSLKMKEHFVDAQGGILAEKDLFTYCIKLIPTIQGCHQLHIMSKVWPPHNKPQDHDFHDLRRAVWPTKSISPRLIVSSPPAALRMTTKKAHKV